LVYAHVQGVRELRNRNRFAFATGSQAVVTMVRGRDVWRVTTAQPVAEQQLTHRAYVLERKVLALCVRLVTHEEPHPELYALLLQARQAFRQHEMRYSTAIEVLTAARVLYLLGYVASSAHGAVLRFLTESNTYDAPVLTLAHAHTNALIVLANTALLDASS